MAVGAPVVTPDLPAVGPKARQHLEAADLLVETAAQPEGQQGLCLSARAHLGHQHPACNPR